MNRKQDLLKVAKREKTFATLASKEGAGAKKRLQLEKKRKEPQSEKDTRWEIQVDEAFAKTRAKKADLAKKLAMKIKNDKTNKTRNA